MAQAGETKLDSEGWTNATVGQDGAGMVESLCREAQGKTGWKLLPQGINNLR